MKKYSLLIVLLMLMSFGICYSQTQTLTLIVPAAQTMTFSATTATITLTTLTAGSDFTPVSSTGITYSISHNSATTKKITAGIDVAMPVGTTLTTNLQSGKGISLNAVDISNATVAVDVVTGIAKGADNNKTLTYVFSALATVSPVTLTKTITYTVTN